MIIISRNKIESDWNTFFNTILPCHPWMNPLNYVVTIRKNKNVIILKNTLKLMKLDVCFLKFVFYLHQKTTKCLNWNKST